jgi:glycosidase
MRDILLFWADHGADGFRCDMAEMVPVEFWEWVIPQVKEAHKDLVFIAEVYQPHLYYDYIFKGHFDYLYDKVGMYEYLRGVTSKNYAVEGISNYWQAVDNIREHMLYFLENHDEQRIASGFFCGRGICAEPAMIVAATLGTNPVMIYAGQELGEQGMDVEGFSGMDGRTTIFDYWGVRSLQAWANKGKWDGAGLDDEQHELREFYTKLLNIARTEKAVTEGKMYDLEYAQTGGFNKHEQFVYLRHYAGKKGKGETLLFVLNFDDHGVDVPVRIPDEAFRYMELAQRDEVKLKDLLTGKEIVAPFKANQIITVPLAAWKGAILKAR